MMAIRYDIRTLSTQDFGKVELDESYFGGKCPGNRGRENAGKVLVFEILTQKGRALVEVVPKVTAVIRRGLTVQKARR